VNVGHFLFSEANIEAPFSLPDTSDYFTSMEKVSAFALLVGAFLGGVSAISFFYLAPGSMTAKKISSEELPSDTKVQKVWFANPISSTQELELDTGESFTAAVSMLVFDLKKEVSLEFHEGGLEDLKKGIVEAGLKPIVTKLGNTSNKPALLAGLRHLVQRFGSAVVPTTYHEIERAVVVDEVSEDFEEVSCRDPYDGSALAVTGKAFIKQFKGGDILQIEGPKRFS
jgi:hypothetical protein